MAWVESNCPSDCVIVWGGGGEGMLNAMIIANVPPDLPTTGWAATLDPGYHSFLK